MSPRESRISRSNVGHAHMLRGWDEAWRQDKEAAEYGRCVTGAHFKSGFKLETGGVNLSAAGCLASWDKLDQSM